MKLISKLVDSDFNLKKVNCVFRKRRAARAVVLCKNKIALMYVGNLKCLSLPGGGIEGKESIKVAVLREVMEETGCSAKIIKVLGRIEEKRTHSKFEQISYCFLVNAKKEKRISLTKNEIKNGTKLKWFSLNKIKSIIESNKSNKYDGKFIAKRTNLVLNEALEYIL